MNELIPVIQNFSIQIALDEVENALQESVERLLIRSVLDAFGIAHKAGRVAIGFSKAEAALAGDPVVALLHAAEASADGVRKITAAARRRFDGGNTWSTPVRVSPPASGQAFTA